mmetsp:Transcript_18590/g.60862  ORF Transcript_18590/g.60862 Transcript_18590/m.60862 type:complete len:239 (+) Transcript_18590:356-1072(+)
MTPLDERCAVEAAHHIEEAQRLAQHVGTQLVVLGEHRELTRGLVKDGERARVAGGVIQGDACASLPNDRQVDGEGGLERGQVGLARGARAGRLTLLLLGGQLKLHVLNLGEQLPHGIQVECVLAHLPVERPFQQAERLAPTRRPARGLQLAQAAHGVGGERRVLAAGLAEEAQGLRHVTRRLVGVLELLLGLADAHVGLGDDRRVGHVSVGGVLALIMRERLLQDGQRLRHLAQPLAH